MRRRMMAAVLAAPALAQGAALRLLAGGSLTAAMQELAPRFEALTGRRLTLFFGPTPGLIAEIVSGRPFDLAVVPADVFADAAARAWFEPGPTIDIARAGYGVAVREGTPLPDVSTPERLRAALLAAGSVSTLPASAAGAHVLAVFARLGIAAEMAARLRPQATTAGVPAALLSGEAEIAVFLSNVLAVPGVALAGPLPGDLQQELLFTAGIAAGTPQADAARALLGWLRGPEARAVLLARGLGPA